MIRKVILCTLIATSLLFGACRASVPETISQKEAQNIALEHAGLTFEEITFIRSSMDMDDGQNNYDVSFYTKDGMEYDYEIDPYSGEVMDYDLEKERIYD